MGSSQRASGSGSPRRWRFQFSLRTLLLAVTLAALWLGWETHRAQRMAEAVARLRELGDDGDWGGMEVVVTEVRSPQWLWGWIGTPLGHRIVRANVPALKAESAIPLLEELSDLRSVCLVVSNGGAEEDAVSFSGALGEPERTSVLIQRALPNVKTTCVYTAR